MAKQKKKSKKKHTKRPFDPTVLNRHHLLWISRRWDNAGQYAHALRTHEYMIKPIPRDTLHMEIHMTLGHIPIPNEELCFKAFNEINERLKAGTISMDDTIEKRIDTLLDIWDFDSCPKTVLALRWQREIVKAFYQDYSPPDKVEE